jgi:hypothetical protein
VKVSKANNMINTTKRYSLNAKQIHILKLTYKFRFITSSLLARYKGISRISSNKSLKILLEQDYLGTRYDKSYKIQGKAATYYLAKKALTYLRDQHHLNEQVLHAQYKNKTVGNEFIDHNINIFEAYLALRHSYPDAFHIFTKAETVDYGYFPEPRPDLYLNRINPVRASKNEYLLDIFTDTQLFIIKKRIAVYLEHFESGDWETEAETIYPAILIACPDSRLEERLQTHIAKVLYNSGIDELKIYTTTVKALVGSDALIWSNVTEPEKLLSL